LQLLLHVQLLLLLLLLVLDGLGLITIHKNLEIVFKLSQQQLHNLI